MIYLLTFHGSVNYGACLQAYALHQAVNKLGCENTVIDYNRGNHHHNYLAINKGNFKGLIYAMLRLPRKLITSYRFNKFVKRKLRMTRSYNGTKSLSAFSYNESDKFIVGSDQVWNLELTNYDTNYLLSFVNTKNKYSFSSSFGKDTITNHEEKLLRKYLQAFSKISVREESGMILLEKEIGLFPEVVCDPTFLLTPDEWSRLVKRKKPKRDFVLVFMLSYNQVLHDAAVKYSIDNNLDLINIVYENVVLSEATNLHSISPGDWLYYVRHAKATFTNSFHGLALSLNYRRQVWFTLTNNNRNTRILSICNRYKISDHLLSAETPLEFKPIDYDHVYPLIEFDRKHSIEYLKSIVID